MNQKIINKKSRPHNHSLDILKAICAILIIFNHCVFPQKLGIAIKDISRIGVPIFFMISGYFSLSNSPEKLKSKTIRIFKMLIGASIFWIIYTLVRDAIVCPEEIKPYLTQFVTPNRIARSIFFNENLAWGHLWFLNALTYCYGLKYLFLKIKIKNKVNIAITMSILLLLSYLLINAVVLKGSFDHIYYIRNFIFVGIPFFAIGNIIHYKNLNTYLNNKTIISLLISSIILLLIETKYFTSELFISTIIASIALFTFCLNNPNYKNTHLEYLGSNLNLYTYILHPAVKYIVLDIIGPAKDNSIIYYLYPLIVAVFTIALSYIIFRIESLAKNPRIHN